MESYKFISEASSTKVEKLLARSIFIVDKAKTPELYADTLAGEYKLPSGVFVVLKDGDSAQIALGDDESTFPDSIVFGGSVDTTAFATKAELAQKIPDGGTNGQVLKKDANGNNIWAADANTTYTAMTAAEAQAGTVTTARTIAPNVLAAEIDRRIAAALAAQP